MFSIHLQLYSASPLALEHMYSLSTAQQETSFSQIQALKFHPTIDKDGAHPDRVMQENWGGDIPMVQISPLQGQNVDDLLETIMLVAKTPAQVPD
ncbi:fructose-1,6-bisphosphatase, chloroplastic [Trifolium repens]|nr:fructose-1,6-bisphosphatase, chloroplastic [Trifolium repens]